MGTGLTHRLSNLEGAARNTVSASFHLHCRSENGRRRCSIDKRHSHSSMKRLAIEILQFRAHMLSVLTAPSNVFSNSITDDKSCKLDYF